MAAAVPQNAPALALDLHSHAENMSFAGSEFTIACDALRASGSRRG